MGNTSKISRKRIYWLLGFIMMLVSVLFSAMIYENYNLSMNVPIYVAGFFSAIGIATVIYANKTGKERLKQFGWGLIMGVVLPTIVFLCLMVLLGLAMGNVLS